MPTTSQFMQLSSDISYSAKSQVVLSQTNFNSNVSILRGLLQPKTQLGCMTKGNAYGLGFESLLELAHDKVDVYFSLSYSDAFKIREIEKNNKWPKKRIIIHGDQCVDLETILQAVNQDIETVMSSGYWLNYFKQIKELYERGKTIKKIPVHIFVDTGLGREGFRDGGAFYCFGLGQIMYSGSTLAEDLEFLRDYLDFIEIKGVMSHLAIGYFPEGASDPSLEQIERFNKAHEYINTTFAKAIPGNLEKSLANSHGTLCHPESHGNIVRVGFTLNHGLWPLSKSKEIAEEKIWQKTLAFKPVLSWKVQLIKVRELKQNETIHSLDNHIDRATVSRNSIIGIFGGGSIDGYDRPLPGKKAFVLIKGKKCPVLFVELENILVDITDVYQNDDNLTATLIGEDANESISANDLASWSPTDSAYAVLTRINLHTPRKINYENHQAQSTIALDEVKPSF